MSSQAQVKKEGSRLDLIDLVVSEDNEIPNRVAETMGTRYALFSLHPGCKGLTLDFTFGPEKNGYSKMSVNVRKTEAADVENNQDIKSKHHQEQDHVDQDAGPGATKNGYGGSSGTNIVRGAEGGQVVQPFPGEEPHGPSCLPPQGQPSENNQNHCKIPLVSQTAVSVAAKRRNPEDEPEESKSTMEEDWDPFSEFDYKLPSKLKEASKSLKNVNDREKDNHSTESMMNYATAVHQTKVDGKANLINQCGAGPGRILSRSMSHPNQIVASAIPISRSMVPVEGENLQGKNDATFLPSKSSGWIPVSQYPVQRKWQSSFANINMDTATQSRNLATKRPKGYSFCSDVRTEGNDALRPSKSDGPSRLKTPKLKRKRPWRAAGGTVRERTNFHDTMRRQTKEWVVSSPQHVNFKSFEEANPAVCQALKQRLQTDFPSCYDEELVDSLLATKYRNLRRNHRAFGGEVPADAQSNQ